MQIRASYWLLILLVAFLFWANYFELDESVRAQGQVIPSSRTQIIQVADGGVLDQLNVEEGQVVEAGEVLASLEKDRARAGVSEIQARLANLEIARLRAGAEAEASRLDFGDYRTSHRAMVLAQRALYVQNQKALEDEVGSLKKSLSLAESELSILQELLKTGDVAKLNVVRVERDVVDLRAKIQDSYNRRVTEARTEIAQIEDELARNQHRLNEQLSVLEHTDIIAPLDGVVKYLRINTLGGVLRSGDELMQISPTGGGYVIEAKIAPADIGRLELDLPANVRLDAFDYSIYGSMKGSLIYLSSDTLSERGADDRTNTYYRAHIEVPAEQVNPKLSTDLLKPGMTALIDVQTGKRTVLEFIAKPILRAFSGALSQR